MFAKCIFIKKKIRVRVTHRHTERYEVETKANERKRFEWTDLESTRRVQKHSSSTYQSPILKGQAVQEKYELLGWLALEIEPISCLESSIKIYQHMQR